MAGEFDGAARRVWAQMGASAGVSVVRLELCAGYPLSSPGRIAERHRPSVSGADEGNFMFCQGQATRSTAGRPQIVAY